MQLNTHIGDKEKSTTKESRALFESLFAQYFQPLVTYAFRYVNDWQVAEDLVQDVFMSLWIHQSEINFTDPIKPYLYRSTYNRALNHLTSAREQRRIPLSGTPSEPSVDEQLTNLISSFNQYDSLLLKEVTHEISTYVNSLPPQCRKVFQLSRGAHLKNKEIAALLDVSEKAVEKHITRALSGIRQHLAELDLLPAVLIAWLIK